MVKSGFAEVGGAKFYYEEAGEGPPLVLVHAGVCDRRMWDAQFHAFAESQRVIRYDRRGFGETETGAEVYSHHRDLHQLLEKLGVESATLVGCSQGGKTVIDFTLEHPERTRALVLIASALGGFEFAGELPRQWREIELADEAGDIERVNELELQIWIDGPRRAPGEVDGRVRELVREMNAVALRKSASLSGELKLEPPAVHRLNELRAPTLIIVGDMDTHATLAAADFMATHISGARKVVIEGTAHLPNMERPAEFNHHVLSFLGSAPRVEQIS